jgi:hypothetical protein
VFQGTDGRRTEEEEKISEKIGTGCDLHASIPLSTLERSRVVRTRVTTTSGRREPDRRRPQKREEHDVFQGTDGRRTEEEEKKISEKIGTGCDLHASIPRFYTTKHSGKVESRKDAGDHHQWPIGRSKGI